MPLYRRIAMNTRKQAMFCATVLGLALVLTLSGCHPTISKSVTKQAERNLSFAEIRENPDQHLGKVVVLGGTVIRTETRQDETVMEVQEKRLGGTMEPRDGDDKTGGRFLVVFPGPLDPAEYTKGRRITVGGQIEGKERMTSGEQDEAYPVIRAMDSRLWDTCGDGLYAYSYYKDYYGGMKSTYHKSHVYAYRCR
jgi:outer membrane lipoprotein